MTERIWSLAFGALFSLAFWLAGPAIVRTLTSLPDIREEVARLGRTWRGRFSSKPQFRGRR